MTILLHIVLAGLALFSLAHASDPVTCNWQECDVECDSGKRRCDRTNGKVWNIDCHVQTCAPVDGCGRADVVFVFDSSASIGERNWWVLKQFAIDVCRGLNIGYNESRIAAVTYSRTAITHWDLGVHRTLAEVEEHIWELPWLAEVTNTQDGLVHAQKIIERSARSEVKHMVVVITDGVSNVNQILTIPQAEIMHGAGIEIFTIGVGNIDEHEINGIGSEPKDHHCHYVTDFNALVAITRTIINDTCESASEKNTECEEFSEWSECQLEDAERQCGNGNHTRSRFCKFYVLGGIDYSIRIHTEYIPCSGPPCPPTEAPPPPVCVWSECDQPCGVGSKTCTRTNGKIWTIPCHVQSCNQVANCDIADLVILMDSSASIGERNWWRVKQFAIDVVKGLPIGLQDILMGAVTFSAEAETHWGLTEFTTEAELEDKLWALEWKKSVTNTQDGLSHARQVVEAGARPGVKRIVIVLTDGESNVQKENTIPIAQGLQDAGIQVFSIGVRDTGYAELNAIASDPDATYVHSLHDYDALTAITQTIINQACLAARGLL